MAISIAENEIKKEINPESPDLSYNNNSDPYKRPVRSNIRNARSFLFSSPQSFKPARAKSLVKPISQPSQQSSTQQSNIPIAHPAQSPKPTHTTERTFISAELNDFNFPIKTDEELSHLNDVLSANQEFRSNFVNRFSIVRYSKSKRSKFNLAYAVIDAAFDKCLLAEYTWADKGQHRKSAFNDFEYIVETFCECVAARDKRYTKERSIFFLHKILFRNSKWRSVKARQAKPKATDSGKCFC